MHGRAIHYGTSGKKWPVQPRSAYGLFADIRVLSGDFADVPKGDITPGSLDHLVGAGEEERRKGEPEAVGSLEIDDEVEFRGFIDRQIAGLGTAQDAIDIAGGAPEAGVAWSLTLLRAKLHCASLFSFSEGQWTWLPSSARLAS